MGQLGQLREAIGLLTEACQADLVVWAADGRLFVKGPQEAEPVAQRLLGHKDLLLPLLADRRLEVTRCLGDDCEAPILLIDGEGWCAAHQMTVRLEGICA